MGALDGLGEALTRLRARARLSQQEVADRAATDRSSISRYETERAAPELKTLGRILDALGTDLVGLGFEMRRVTGQGTAGAQNEALAVLHDEIQAALARAGWKPEEKTRRGRATISRDRK